MHYVKSYKELEVYQKTRELSRIIYILSKDFPFDEKFSLTDQIRRSSRSVGAQIAESIMEWSILPMDSHFDNRSALTPSEMDKSSLFCSKSKQ